MIWQHPNWPDFKWDHQQIAGQIIRARRTFEILSEKVHRLPDDQMLSVESLIYTVEIMASSEMAGLSFNWAEVLESVENRLNKRDGNGRDFSPRINDFLDILIDASTPPFQALTSQRLKGWHSRLFQKRSKGEDDDSHAAEYLVRDIDKPVLAVKVRGQMINYVPPPLEKIGAELELFETWFNSEISAPLFITSGIALLWFEILLPFADGNGAVGRAVCDLAISKDTRSPKRLINLSPFIMKQRKLYNQEVDKVRLGDLDITSWLWLFLEMVNLAIRDADLLISGARRKAAFWDEFGTVPVTDRQRFVLNQYLLEIRPILTVTKWAAKSQCSESSARRDIQYLLDNKMLIQVGATSKKGKFLLAGTTPGKTNSSPIKKSQSQAL